MLVSRVWMVSKLVQRVVADSGVGGERLHDTDLGRPNVVGEVLVVSIGSGQNKEEDVTNKSNTELNTTHNLQELGKINKVQTKPTNF